MFCVITLVTVLDWKVLNGVLRFFVLFYIPNVLYSIFVTNNCLIRCYKESLTVSNFVTDGGLW